MLKLALLTLVFVALSVLFLCVKMILKPGSKFGSTHIGGSKAMRDRGIHCVQHQYRSTNNRGTRHA